MKEAEDADALTREQRSKWLADWDESDHGSGVFVRDLIWEDKEERIEAWRNDERMQEAESERHWLYTLPQGRQEGKSIANFSDIEERNAQAIARRRRLIDDWQAEQAGTRKAVQEEMARLQGREYELPWWQVCTGI